MAEENKALVRRSFEAFNAGNLTAVDELYTPNYVNHFIPPGQPQGPDGEKQLQSMLRTAFPDIRTIIEDTIAEGDRVVLRMTFRGTHRGDFQGIPPSGKQVTVNGIAIFRVAGGKIAEVHPQIDMLGLMQQLGVIPAPGVAG